MINDFVSIVKRRGLARTNRYTISIPFPSGPLWAVDGESARVTNILCDTVQLPGVSISTVPQRIYGEEREMPYEKKFEPVTTTFYVDSEMRVKYAFDLWMAQIVDPLNRSMGYYDNYRRDIEIYVENVDGSRPMKVVLYEAYPRSAPSIQLDYASKDAMKLSVTWQYKYWYSTILKGGVPPPTVIPPQDIQGITTGAGFQFTT